MLNIETNPNYIKLRNRIERFKEEIELNSPSLIVENELILIMEASNQLLKDLRKVRQEEND